MVVVSHLFLFIRKKFIPNIYFFLATIYFPTPHSLLPPFPEVYRQFFLSLQSLSFHNNSFLPLSLPVLLLYSCFPGLSKTIFYDDSRE